MKRTLRAILYVFLSLASVHNTFAQQVLSVNETQSDKEYVRARTYYERALAADKKGVYDTVAFYIRQSLAISLRENFTALSADNYRLLGMGFDRNGDWENTLRSFLRAGAGYDQAGLKIQEADIWNKIAEKYYSFKVYSKAKEYAGRSYRLIPATEPERKAAVSELTAKSSFMMGNYGQAVQWFDKATVWYIQTGDMEGKERAMQGSASSYIEILTLSEPLEKTDVNRLSMTAVMTTLVLGKVTASLAVMKYEELLEIHKKENNIKARTDDYNSLGYLFFKQGDYAKAIGYFTLAAEEMKGPDGNNYELASTLTNLAICYQNTSDETKMRYYLSKALAVTGDDDSFYESSRIDHIMARIYLQDNDYYHAELYCRECIAAAKKSGNLPVLQQCYQTLSEVKEKGNDFIKALEYFQRHLVLRDSLSLLDEMENAADDQRVRNYEALEQKLLMDISDEDRRLVTIRNLRTDSLIMRSNLRALRSDSLSKQSEIMALRATAELKASEQKRLRQEYDLEVERNRSEQQQRDIQVLEQEKIISDLTLKAQQDEQERLQQEITLEKARRKTAIIFVILAIMIALAILANLISSRSKNKKLAQSKKRIEEINLDLENKNREISSQKEVIEDKNKSITDSIQYASRIQAAVLPPVSFMDDWGLENFILFMPKDIVSGDFYWGARKRGKIIIAAADCTGHGVPGAFMSMLGNAFLNEIVNSAEHLDAATILNILRDEVIRALKQKGISGEARDGMDIALCVLDPETMTGTFAGANNPLYLVRKGELNKIQADRMPIGIHIVAEKPFTNQPLELIKGDAVYMFTDGYADQFGGPAGKKFMYKPFQQLLMSIAHHTSERQYEILHSTFTSWQDGNEQVDDVLVLGFKI